MELNTFIVDRHTVMELEANGHAKKDVEAKFERLKSNISAFMG